MALDADFQASGLTEEGYVRTVWSETELTADALASVDLGWLAADDVANAVKDAIRDLPATDVRKNFYRKLVLDYVGQDDGRTLDEFIDVVASAAGDEESKRERLAALFTRVLRGEVATNVAHRQPAEANAILAGKGFNPWCAALEKLRMIEASL